MDAGLDPVIERVLFPGRTAAGTPSHVRHAIAAARDATLDLLFPPHCASCGEALPAHTNTALCLACAQAINWIGRDRCRRCGDAVGLGAGAVDDCPSCRTHPPVFVQAACAVARYHEEPMRQLVLAMKFSAKLHLARPLGRLLAERVKATELYAPDLVVVPTPLTLSLPTTHIPPIP
ncbi:MAG: double zinc ribbon domain-containing protein [Planctomycetota bacterium]|nr:double zinc ribbon domain-containing protein [Planctomycetota bacterium]